MTKLQVEIAMLMLSCTLAYMCYIRDWPGALIAAVSALAVSVISRGSKGND